MTGIFINSENLSRFEIKKQIRGLTNDYNSDLLIDLYNEFNFFSVGELMKINSYTKKINELEFKSNYIKEEGFIVDFFPKTEYKIVSGIIKYIGHEKFRLNNLNFEDYQDFLNLTFDFSRCFTEIVTSINQTNASFDGVVKHDVIDKLGITQSSIDFFKNVNQNLVSELDIINFIDERTKNELSKLELLKKDLEAFEVNFISDEVVESLMSDKVYKSKSISDLFDKFKETVINKIEITKTVLPQQLGANKSDEVLKNPHETIFKDNFAFILFEKMKGFYSNQTTDLANYSFLFYAMQKDGFVICGNIDFVKLLSTYNINIDKIDPRQSGTNKKTNLYNATKESFQKRTV